MKKGLLQFTLWVLLFSCTSLHAQIYVNRNATGANTGTSWNDAFTDLQSAINLAGYGAQVWVAQGTYHPTSGTNRNISFQIANGVEVYGGFQGGETSLAQRDWKTYRTILSGNIGTVVNTDNSYVVVNYAKTSTTGKLDGLVIQDGYADGLYQVSGAAVMINSYATPSNGSIQFKNMVFQNNYASSNGGAVYIEAGNGGSLSPSFDSCDFISNKSNSSGGAVYNSAYGGGSINTMFTQCFFSLNYSLESGAAVFNHGGTGGNCTPTFSKCDFDNNTAVNGHGGGMYNLGSGTNGNSTPSIDNCRFFNNSGFAAGAIYNNGSTGGNSSPIITNSTFVRNYITGAGGGGIIYNNGSDSGNSSTIVTNCIIWGNTAPYNSHVFKSVEGTPTISYSIVDVPDCFTLNSGLDAAVTCGAGVQFNVDPKFMDETNGDLRLQDSSPAIDAGDNAQNTATLDLDGETRIMYSFIDIGAYEKVISVLPIELSNFEANIKGDKVELTWLTLSEIQNDFFTIERLNEKGDFIPIAKVNGAGNSSLPLNYSTIDHAPKVGHNYYRLKQTDLDGGFSYSKVVQAFFEKGKRTLSIYPNPVQDKLIVSMEEVDVQKVEYKIFDILGNMILHQKIEVLNGGFEIREVSQLINGTYIIQLISDGQDAMVHKFQKK